MTDKRCLVRVASRGRRDRLSRMADGKGNRTFEGRRQL
jgi:hypothetical protein